MRIALAITVLLTSTMGATGARALERGDSCTIKSPLAITMRGSSGVVESTVDAGTLVEVVGVGEGGITRIRAGEVKGDVSTADLEGACAGTLRICKLTAAVMMYKENRSDSQAFRIKPGATVSILKKGKTWAAVRVGDLQGFVKADEITNSCAFETLGSAGGSTGNDVDNDGPTDAVERGEGPGVLFLPWYVEGAAPTGSADAFLDALFARAAFYRPDAGRLGADGARDGALKKQIAEAATRAKRADTAFVVVGRLAIDTSPAPAAAASDAANGAPLLERYIVSLALVDAKTGKVAKGIKAKPSERAEDDWAERVLAALLPALPAAPGSKLPVVSGKATFEVAPNPNVEGTKAAPATAPLPETPRSAWFSNAWGYIALATAVAAGTGSAVVGSIALEGNERANSISQADPRRADERNNALATAITADALGVVAAGAAVTSVVVFATRAGMDD